MKNNRNGISTHSLTRRLTITTRKTFGQVQISTHSLTRRLTWRTQQLMRRKHFNSQPHKEADIYLREPCGDGSISTHSLTRRLTYDWMDQSVRDAISTHSLTRRLTFHFFLIPLNFFHFNSQPHKEADGKDNLYTDKIRYFNSQPHTEADSSGSVAIIPVRTFQLTASQGG